MLISSKSVRKYTKILMAVGSLNRGVKGGDSFCFIFYVVQVSITIMYYYWAEE